MSRITLAGITVTALVITLDVVFVHPILGLAGSLAMLALLSGLGLRVWRVRAQLGSAVRRVELAVLVAAAAFAAARIHALFADLEQAAQRHALVFLLLVTGAALALPFAARMSRLAEVMARRPSVVLSAGFLGLILVTGLLLSLPVSLRDPSRIPLLDGFFMMTSAVCVTGLSSLDLGSTYTLFGQIVLLVGVQLGGIGVTTVAAFALTLQRETALDEHAHYVRVMEARTLHDLRRLVRNVVLATLVIEAFGALGLWLHWGGSPWAAVFHAISAFCNAGFSLHPDNLVRYQTDPITLGIIMALVTLGGIGFPVIAELVGRLFRRRTRERISTTTRIVLAVSALLTAGGALLFLAFEWNQTMETMDLSARSLNALFQSVVARTAGFNTIDFAAARSTTLFVFIVLMFIGGSPASAAGGIKTTTIAVLVATLIAELRGREARLYGRTIAPDTLRRAVAVASLSLTVVVLLVVGLTLTERQPFLVLAFEAVSAFATVGFSAGLTPLLSDAGKLLIMLGMFVGRVGPLTVVTLVGDTAAATRHRLPPEQIPVG
jgi:trk system potassium uptake protein